MTKETPKIGIISYCDSIRTYASLNHQFYADKHKYTYIYDIAPTHHGVFKNKIEKLLKYLKLFDWVFWIDDDAFFLQYGKPLEELLNGQTKHDLVFCSSPLNEHGDWTYLSSGNFFLRNTPKVKEWLQACLDTKLSTVERRWNFEKGGIFTKGDQDIMTFLLLNDRRFNGPLFHTTLNYEAFNTRPTHFQNKPSEYFLVHFTGTDKYQQSLDFAKKFKLSPALTPKRAMKDYSGIFAPNNP